MLANNTCGIRPPNPLQARDSIPQLIKPRLIAALYKPSAISSNHSTLNSPHSTLHNLHFADHNLHIGDQYSTKPNPILMPAKNANRRNRNELRQWAPINTPEFCRLKTRFHMRAPIHNPHHTNHFRQFARSHPKIKTPKPLLTSAIQHQTSAIIDSLPLLSLLTPSTLHPQLSTLDLLLNLTSPEDDNDYAAQAVAKHGSGQPTLVQVAKADFSSFLPGRHGAVDAKRECGSH